LTQAAAGSPRLAKVLAGADVPASAKQALVEDLGRGAFSQDAVGIAVKALTHTDGKAAEALATTVVDHALEVCDSIEIENDLQLIGGTIEESNDLRQALSDMAVANSHKSRLLADLFEGKASPAGAGLANMYLYLHNGRGLAEELLDVARRAADKRGARMVEIVTAVELDESRRSALIAALESSYQRPVQPRFVVDESIGGSVVVRAGDEVMDGSVRHRLDQAKAALTS